MSKDKNFIEQNNSTADVLKTLLYFNAFKYPLTTEEIIFYSKYSNSEIKSILDKLVEKKIAFNNQEFYSLSDDSSLITRRKKGNLKAKKTLNKAKKMANIISQFPFVEAVFLSGSISKGFLGKDDDIDYFIITSPNRLWLTKSLLILYRKIFLFNSIKYFCTNYFMSINALEIPEKNRFTATEFVTLIPMTGNGIYHDFKKQNPWVLNFFPKFSNINKDSNHIKKNLFRRFLELIFKGKIGDYFDSSSMKIIQKFQKNKYKKLTKTDFKIAFKGQKNVSKHHPSNHQKRVINILNESIIEYNAKHKLSIPLEK